MGWKSCNGAKKIASHLEATNSGFKSENQNLVDFCIYNENEPEQPHHFQNVACLNASKNKVKAYFQ